MVTISEKKCGDEQNHPALSESEKKVLSFLAAKPRVDVRWLSKQDKLRIRGVLDKLHNGKRLSLLQISKEVGKSYIKIWGLCKALEIRTRSVAEADRNSAELRSKHKRSSFDGTDREKAYLLGFRSGDLTALQVSGTAVMVSSTTTHPAFAKLFHEMFSRYGHIYQYPMFEEAKGFSWKLATRLNNSFQFLLATSKQTLDWSTHNRQLFLSWLAGILDSDGNINIVNGNGYARIMLIIYNTNEALLRSIREALEVLKYHPVGPYLRSKAGTITRGWNVAYTKDMWMLQLERTAESKTLLSELPLKHAEKIQRKGLALSIRHRQEWKDVRAEVLSLRNRIRNDVATFAAQARKEFLTRGAKN